MRIFWRTRTVLLFCLLTAGLACAHEPAMRAAKSAQPQRMMVTGSHIPVLVDPDSGMAATFSPVRFYNRARIESTGRQYDLRAAMLELDPSISR